MIEKKQVKELVNLISQKLNKNFSNVENREIAKLKLGIGIVNTYASLPVNPKVTDIYLVRDASSIEDNLEAGEWALYECTSISPVTWTKISDKYATITDFGTW